ncbi:hypothetical protein [Dictyobacter kobayashii]|uniref:Uncharacterized protein n=1 Tax=Dictyobacter kobayashii TaxID=2014872 RepID=A0A402AT31_9CHLR|nr:hypothetical protein [Dictyobacter kobayashii]GCE22290.1 hypothetical protein KDK_60900 [Dictyobacter kobayashii]
MMQNEKIKLRKLRTRVLGVFIALLLLLISVGFLFNVPGTANAAHLPPANSGARSNSVAGGSGATLPYVEMEAHSAATKGTIVGPSFQLGDLASDAVDRTIVQLTQGNLCNLHCPNRPMPLISVIAFQMRQVAAALTPH